MKRIMAVYDADPFYADRLAEFVNQKELTPFAAVAFTSMERLHRFAGEHGIELLLVGDGVEAREWEDIAAGQVVRLAETRLVREGEPAVYKYQASDQVLREVMACYQLPRQEGTVEAAGGACRIAGVYSPVGRCGKTGFAVTLGQVLAQDSRVLYLNLEEFSGFSSLLKDSYSGSVSDLIYYYRQGDYDQMRLGSLVYSWGKLDYVPPMPYAEDRSLLDGKEISGLVRRIAGESGYHVIILDLGHFLRNAEAIWELCSVIYAPVKEDACSAAKLEEWKQYLEISGRQRLWDRVKVLRLPKPRLWEPGNDYFEQLIWGELGDFVRELTGQQKRTEDGRGEYGDG